MYVKEASSSGLAEFLMEFDVCYVDTCSLMEEGFPAFMDTLLRSRDYWDENAILQVIVLGETVKELKRIEKEREERHARIAVKRALKILRHDKWHGKVLTRTKASKGEDFADKKIYADALALRSSKRILVITQDTGLTKDILSLNDLKSQHGRKIAARRIEPDGRLTEIPAEKLTEEAFERRRLQKKGLSGLDLKKAMEKNKVAKGEAKKSQSPELEELIKQDSVLSANLHNPKFPTERKLPAIKEQLNRLNAALAKKVSVKDAKLTYDKGALIHLIREEEDKAKPVSKPESPKAPAVSKEAPKAVEPKKAKKEQEKSLIPVFKAESAMEEDSNKAVKKPDKPLFEINADPFEAVRVLLVKAGVIVRAPKVSYVEEIHGPVDVTSDNLERSVKALGELKPGSDKELKLGSVTVKLSKMARGDTKAQLIQKAEKPQPEAKSFPEKPIPKRRSVKEPAKAEAKKEEPKRIVIVKAGVKETPKKVSKTPSEQLTEALKKEVDLHSKLNNSNYPLKLKIRDIDEQLQRVRKLTPTEQRKLRYGIKALKEQKSLLSPKG